MMKKILIVDDEVNIGLLLSKFLTRNSFIVETATSGSSAMDILSKQRFDLVLCDYRLEDTDGKDILIKIKEFYPKTGVIIITGYSDIKLAVELIKLGAYDYITKPLYPDEILNTIKRQHYLGHGRPAGRGRSAGRAHPRLGAGNQQAGENLLHGRLRLPQQAIERAGELRSNAGPGAGRLPAGSHRHHAYRHQRRSRPPTRELPPGRRAGRAPVAGHRPRAAAESE